MANRLLEAFIDIGLNRAALNRDLDAFGRDFTNKIDALNTTQRAKEQAAALSAAKAMMIRNVARFGTGGPMPQDSTRGAAQAAMRMAQLSYAIQDFTTGMAMGNFNMAVMGASNNLGMMAQSLTPLAGGLTVLAAALIPSLIRALEELSGKEAESARNVKNLKAQFDAFQDALSRGTAMKMALFDIGQIKSAETAMHQLLRMKAEGAARSEEIEKRAADIRARRRGIEIIDEQKALQQTGFKGFLDWVAGIDQGVLSEKEAMETLREINELIKKNVAAKQDEIDAAKQRLALEQKLRDTLIGEASTRIGRDLQKRLATPANAALMEAAERRTKTMKEIEESPVSDKRKAELREQADAAFQKEKAEAERQTAERRRRLEDQMHDVVNPAGARRRAIEAEHKQRQAEIEKEYGTPFSKKQQQEKNQAMDRAEQERRVKIDKLNRDEIRERGHMRADLASNINKEDGERMQIQERLRDRIEDINKMNLTEDERKRMIGLAHAGALKQLGDIGPRTSFAGIADLSKQIQQSLSTNPYEADIAKATKDIATTSEESKNALEHIRDEGLKMNPVWN